VQSVHSKENPIAIFLDDAVLRQFRGSVPGTGKGYQALINERLAPIWSVVSPITPELVATPSCARNLRPKSNNRLRVALMALSFWRPALRHCCALGAIGGASPGAPNLHLRTPILSLPTIILHATAVVAFWLQAAGVRVYFVTGSPPPIVPNVQRRCNCSTWGGTGGWPLCW